MQGKVKWFSEVKGYGYIVGIDENDYYFNVHEVQGAELPRKGDAVTFSADEGKKGPRASSVVLSGKSQSNSQYNDGRRSDDRATCPHCGKKMIPRLITYQGNPQKSLCPFCGGVYKEFSSCFIATAVYGDYYAPEVIALRRFRDETLETSAPGRLFVKLYYRFSPTIAAFLSQRRKLSAAVRVILNILARRNG